MKLDFRVDAFWRDNPKFRRLFDNLGADGVVALFTLWGFARAHRPRGILDGMKAPDIAEAARYEGDALKFVRALKSVGFLDRVNGQYELHEWEKHQPYSYHSDDRSAIANHAAAQRWAKRRNDLADAPIPTPSPNPKPIPIPAQLPRRGDSNCGELERISETVDSLTKYARRTAGGRDIEDRGPRPLTTSEAIAIMIKDLESRTTLSEFDAKDLEALRQQLATYTTQTIERDAVHDPSPPNDEGANGSTPNS